MSTGVVNFITRGLCLIGLGLAAYSYYVSLAKVQDPNFKAYCDIDEKFNCSRVLTSPLSKGFGLVSKYLGEKSPLNQHNALYGVGTYGVILLLSFIDHIFITSIVFLLTFISVGMSAYLGYISFFVVKHVCATCCAVYVTNLFLFFTTYIKINKVKGGSKNKNNKNKKKKQK